MKRVHLERGSDLLRALIIIQEDGSSEREKQERMARRLKGKRIDEKDEDELFGDEGGEEEGGDKEGGDEGGEEGGDEKPAGEDKGKEKPKSTKLPGAKRLEDAELKRGEAPTTKDIVQRINFLRAGASLKDEKVKKDIATWIAQLKEPEKLAVFTTLDALAKIVLARKSAAEAPTFSSPGGLEIRGGEEPTQVARPASPPRPSQSQPKSAGPVPITVGEGVVRKLKEIDVPVRSGRVVPFGSKSHITDLTDRIDDLERIRSYQEQGSDSRHAISLAIKALKGQLRAAMKRGVAGNPRTQPVPPIVEKEK